jgi:hypothetical protein
MASEKNNTNNNNNNNQSPAFEDVKAKIISDINKYKEYYNLSLDNSDNKENRKRFLIEFYKTNIDVSYATKSTIVPANDFGISSEKQQSKYSNYHLFDLKVPKEYDSFRTVIPTSGNIVLYTFDDNKKYKNNFITKVEYKTKGVKIEEDNSKHGVVEIRKSIQPPKEFFDLPEYEWLQIGRPEKDNIIIQMKVKKIPSKMYHPYIYATHEKQEAWCYGVVRIALYISKSVNII